MRRAARARGGLQTPCLTGSKEEMTAEKRAREGGPWRHCLGARKIEAIGLSPRAKIHFCDQTPPSSEKQIYKVNQACRTATPIFIEVGDFGGPPFFVSFRFFIFWPCWKGVLPGCPGTCLPSCTCILPMLDFSFPTSESDLVASSLKRELYCVK